MNPIQNVSGGTIVDVRTIAQWLREERGKAKLTQGDVAAAVKIHRSYYNQIENGRLRPEFKTWKAIAGAVNSSLSQRELMEVYMRSNPSAKALNPDEEELLVAFRDGDVSRMLRIIEKRAA